MIYHELISYLLRLLIVDRVFGVITSRVKNRNISSADDFIRAIKSLTRIKCVNMEEEDGRHSKEWTDLGIKLRPRYQRNCNVILRREEIAQNHQVISRLLDQISYMNAKCSGEIRQIPKGNGRIILVFPSLW